MTAVRDPKPGLIQKAKARLDTVAKCKDQLDAARKAYRLALKAAADGGVSKAELGRQFGTGESRIRELILRADTESDLSA